MLLAQLCILIVYFHQKNSCLDLKTKIQYNFFITTKKKKAQWKRYNNKRRSNPVYRKKEYLYYQEWYKKNGRIRNEHYRIIGLRWTKEHPIEVKAQKLLQKAIRKNEIIRPNICEYCKKQRKVMGHHPDYSKPLEVVWLCYSCHKKVHNV